MFKKEKYISRGIKKQISPFIYIFLWHLLDEMEESKMDELQIFILRKKIFRNKLQVVEHIQEEPPYRKIHECYMFNPVNAKIYILIDKERATMFLADEF